MGSKRGRRTVDLTGQTFGELTAIEPTEERYFRNVVWKCRCSCGKQAMVPANYLRTGNTRSCGHLIKPDSITAGDRFGRLVALYKTKEKSGNSYKWSCRCDCGRTINVANNNLSNGIRKSCGCMRRVNKRNIYYAQCPGCGGKFEVVPDGSPTPQFCEECAPKYAGRAWRICVVCDELFPCPPSANNTTCSPECRSIRARKNAETIAAHGTRKWTDERREMARNNPAITEQRKELSVKGIEAAKLSPNSGRFETNVNAKVWKLVDPDGKVYVVQNLLNWARDNAELFGKPCGDKSGEQIAGGFKAIVQTLKGNRGTEGKRNGALYYKGWTLIGLPEYPSGSDRNEDKTNGMD